MKPSFINLLRNQTAAVPSIVQPDLTGRVIIITGGTGERGLGFNTALHFSRCNPSRLIITSRHQAAGKKAIEDIVLANDERQHCVVPEFWILDLGDLKGTKEFAERCEKELGRLDILIFNAGIVDGEFVTTIDGFESVSQVYNIATTLLAVLLFPLLYKTSHHPLPAAQNADSNFKPHLTFLASSSHMMVTEKTWPGLRAGRVDVLQSMQEKELFEANKSPIGSNKETHVITIMNMRYLAEIAGDRLIVNALSPGGVKTGPAERVFKGILKVLFNLTMALIGREPEVASRLLVWAGTQEMPTGSYIDLQPGHTYLSEVSDFILSEEGRKVGAVY